MTRTVAISHAPSASSTVERIDDVIQQVDDLAARGLAVDRDARHRWFG